MSTKDELLATIGELVQTGKGILAADESNPTMAKRLKSIEVEDTEENRRYFRSAIFSTPGLGDFINGIIMFEETLDQYTDEGIRLPDLANQQGIVPGIKVDKGLKPLPGSPGDDVTQGLDGLDQRLADYKGKGARFAKWRCVYHITEVNPGRLAIEANAEVLARYAAICQAQGIVPIVEPEVLMDGNHSIERCAVVTEAVQHEVFHALYRHRVALEYMILKPNMVVPGQDYPDQASPDEVAAATLAVFRRTVPAAVPTINFLSGGQSAEEATTNLNAINRQPRRPWQLSFSFGRALQQPSLRAWMGRTENLSATQAAMHERARLNSLACKGEYQSKMEDAA